MLIIYLGADLYEIHVGHQKLHLSADELAEFTEKGDESYAELEKDYEQLVEQTDKAIEELEETINDLEVQLCNMEKESQAK